MLCCTVLYCAVLCCAVLCCCCAVLLRCTAALHGPTQICKPLFSHATAVHEFTSTRAHLCAERCRESKRPTGTLLGCSHPHGHVPACVPKLASVRARTHALKRRPHLEPTCTTRPTPAAVSTANADSTPPPIFTSHGAQSPYNCRNRHTQSHTYTLTPTPAMHSNRAPEPWASAHTQMYKQSARGQINIECENSGPMAMAHVDCSP